MLIPKKPDDFEVSHLCPILLFYIDCNQNNKHLGWEVMRLAEANDSLTGEQYGSCKDHSAIDKAINKWVLFDILRLERKTATSTAVNLRSCYDLIVHSAASIAMQWQGMLTAPIICMFAALEQMELWVCTAFEDSEEKYGGELFAIPFDPAKGTGHHKRSRWWSAPKFCHGTQRYRPV